MKRRALITGGGSGIGLAIARALSAAGHEVVVAGRDRKKLEETGLAYLIIDVTDDTSIESATKSADPVDIFVANAGAAPTAPSLETTRATWNQALSVNLTSVFSSAQAFAPKMIDRGWGRFVALASTASHRAYPYAAAYAAAKHGDGGELIS